MRYFPFHSNLEEFKKAKDSFMVKDILMSEMSDAIVNRRDDVIDKLNHSGIYVDSSTTVNELTEIVKNNLGNKKFMEGFSRIIGGKNPKDFEQFSAMNGNKVSEGDYYKDVFFAMDGYVKSSDSTMLSDKVFSLMSGGAEQVRKGTGFMPALFVMGLSAGIIYFTAIKPMSKAA
jgi:hypothetical protein